MTGEAPDAFRGGRPERGRPEIVGSTMKRSSTLPAFAALTVAAAAFGVHLGESAIAEINPAYYRGPALHPRDRGAAIDPREFRPAEPSFASFYGWQEGNDARERDCGNCDALAARDAYAPAVYRAPEPEPLPEKVWIQAEAELYEPDPGFVERRRQIERYAFWDDGEKVARVETAAAEADFFIEE